jgi:peptidoglycan/LPS O-acetylase OafA/YrhL
MAKHLTDAAIASSAVLNTPPIKSSSRFYRPELDALRFFAFLCTFAFHWMDYVPFDTKVHHTVFAVLTAGAFGVPIFFLLSSFLIVELLLREREQTGDIHIKSFYVRRILRIWPLYFAVFYGLVILGHWLRDISPHRPIAWLAFTFFAGNWYIMRHGWIAGPVDPLWSIAVEEQFYIAIPLLTRLGGRKLLAALSVVLMVVSYVVSVHYAHMVYSGESGQWVNSWFQFQFFAAGALLAIVLRGRVPRWSPLVRVLAFVAAAALWVIPVMAFDVKSYDGHPTVPGALIGWAMVLGGSVLFFLSVLGTPERYIPRWLVYLGRISFGLYMFHSLMFHLVFSVGPTWLSKFASSLHLPAVAAPAIGTALVLALSIVAAAASYRFFERPFLKLKERFTFVRSRPE